MTPTKKRLFIFLLGLLFAFCAKPFYTQDTVRLSFEAQGGSDVKVRIFYTETEKGRMTAPRTAVRADMTEKQTFSFGLPVKNLYQLKIEFDVPEDSFFLGPVTLSGAQKAVFPLSEKQEQTGQPERISSKDAGIYFDEPLNLAPKEEYNLPAFLFTLAFSFLSAVLILNFSAAAAFAGAVLSYAAFSSNYDVNFALRNSFTASFLFLSFFVFYYKTYAGKKRPFNFPLAFLSILFSTLHFLAFSLHYTFSWELLGKSPRLFFLAAAGQGLLFYTVGLLFFDILKSGVLIKKDLPARITSKLLKFYHTHTVTAAFAVIILCWMPCLVSYYPGTVVTDTKVQLMQAFGLFRQSQHHPFVSTFLISSFFKLGTYLKDENLGAFLYILFQTIVSACIFAMSLDKIRQLGLRPAFQICSLVFFALFPVSGFIIIWGVKDILYSSVFTLFVLQTACLISDAGNIKTRRIFFYGLTLLLVSLLRNNGLYAAAPTAVAAALFALHGTERTKAVTAVLTSLLLFLILTQSVFPALGFPTGSKKEYLTIPFQQTARYVKEYGAELTDEEKRVIARVLNLEKLPELYRSHISDPVKSTYRLNKRSYENEALHDYFAQWLKMFFKHPGVYFKATMAHSYRYYAFTPSAPSFFMNRLEIYDPVFNFSLSEQSEGVRIILDELYSRLWMVFFVYILYVGAFYTWSGLLLGLYSLTDGNRKNSIVLLPLLISMLVCIASPVNGMFRYYLPVIESFPLILAFVASGTRQEQKGEKDAL